MKEEKKMTIKFSRMPMITSVLLITSIIIGMLGTSCIATEPVNEVIIGSVLPLTGPGARFGQVLKNGRDLATEEINAAGGIKSLGGAKIKLIYGDCVDKIDLAVSETKRLIAQYQPAIMSGCMYSTLTLAATEIAERLKVPFLVMNATAGKITQRGFKYTFRCTQGTPACARASFGFLKDVTAKTGVTTKKIALIYEDTDYGVPYSILCKEHAREMGWKVVADEAFPSGTTDLTLTVSKVKGAKPDVIFCVGYINDIILLARTIQALKLDTKAIIHYGGATSMPDFITALANGSEFYFTGVAFAVDMEHPYLQKFIRKYSERYGELPNENADNGYIGMYVIKEVLELAGSTDPEKIREAFHKVNVTEGPATGEGPIKFEETGDLANQRAIITQNLGGKPVTIWPFDLAAAEVVYPIPKWDER